MATHIRFISNSLQSRRRDGQLGVADVGDSNHIGAPGEDSGDGSGRHDRLINSVPSVESETGHNPAFARVAIAVRLQ
jgi:hypothetical protein